MADSTNDRCLAEWLVANGKITSEQLQACLEAQQQASEGAEADK